MKKLIAIAVTIAVIAVSLFVFPAAESISTQVFSRAGFAEGDGGGEGW